jgi:hypothetical protein
MSRILQTLYYVPFEVVTQVAKREGVNIAEVRSQHIFGTNLPCQTLGHLDILHCWLPSMDRMSDWFRAPTHFFIELRRLNDRGRLPSRTGYINWWSGWVHSMSEETIEVRVVIINSTEELDSIVEGLKIRASHF